MTDQEAKRIDAEIASLMAQTAKLNAETAKLIKENRWYLVIVGSTGMLAAVAVARLFLA